MQDAFEHFQLPPQHLKSLSFCQASPQALGEWLLKQPLGQTKEMSVLLYTLLPQINQLDCTSQERIELLDIMRPAVYQCVANCHNQHLCQPLQLDQQSTRIAMMSHALLRHLCDGYLIAIKDALPSSDQETNLAKCMFFALHGLDQLYFHCVQLYANTTPLFWLKAHGIYQLALNHDVTEVSIPAYHSPDETRTIAQAYKRLIMMACSHTNQLPPIDITYLHQAFEDWADTTVIISAQEAGDHSQCRYWANPNEDTAPHNRDQHKSNEDIGFDFTDIVLLLQTHNHYAPGKGVKEIPTFFRHSLAEHLLQCWQRTERRKQARQVIDERFEICVGLDNAYSLLNTHHSDDNSSTYVNAVDSSPDGLCLRWQHKIPKKTEPGQCLLIRSPGKKLWRIGIIRWVHRLNQYTYAGIQLLSEHIAPTVGKLYWQADQAQQSYPSIAFERSNDTNGSVDLLLPKSVTPVENASSHAILKTDHGKETIAHLNKMTEFASVNHYSCTMTPNP